MARKSDKSTSKSATGPAQRKRDALENPGVAKSYETPWISGDRVQREKVRKAAWMLSRIQFLREIIGEPPSSVRADEAILRAVVKKESANGDAIDLNEQEILVSDDDLKKVAKIAAIGESDRKKCFNVLLENKDIISNLRSLFSIYSEFLYNTEVTSEPRDNFRKENVIHEFRSKSERPRWAEENRTGVRFAMRISENLLSEIDSQAKQSGITRTDWIVGAVESFLKHSGRKEPPDSPEFKSTRPIGIRISEELSDKINSEAESHGLSKTEYVRRIARHRLADPGPHLERKFER